MYNFEGDLNQMAKQKRLLVDHGFDIVMWDVHPTVKTEDEYNRAISLIWSSRCEGWWHYKEHYFKHNICTPYEFWSNLGKVKDVKLYHFVTRQEIWDNKVKLNGEFVADVETIVNRGDKINAGGTEIIVN